MVGFTTYNSLVINFRTEIFDETLILPRSLNQLRLYLSQVLHGGPIIES